MNINVKNATINLNLFSGWIRDFNLQRSLVLNACAEKAVKQGFFTAPSMAVDDNHRIDKPHNVNGFQDVMERVCNGAGVKNTKYEKELRARHMF